MEKKMPLNALGLAGQLGFTISVPLLLFTGAGFLADKNLNTKPLYTLVGLGIGMIVSLFSLYRTIKPYLGSEKKK